MIESFKDRQAQAIFEGRHPGKGFPADLIRIARRKLVMLDEAEALGDLGKLPGNRLEALRNDRGGQHSIRINDQWRACFVWTGSDAPERRDRRLSLRTNRDAYRPSWPRAPR